MATTVGLGKLLVGDLLVSGRLLVRELDKNFLQTDPRDHLDPDVVDLLRSP